MRTFSNFPQDNKCPICKTNSDSECFLMPIDGTNDGNICQAIPVHTTCGIDIINKLVYNKENDMVYCFIDES